jgi:hypothetical protein
MPVNKIDSNVTGLRTSEELSIGVVDPSAVWLEHEPNSYADFGGQVTTVARNPITADRQRKKGVSTDLDASGGFSADITQESLLNLGQGVFFADMRTKDRLAVATVNTGGVTDDFEPASGGAAYIAGDLLWGEGFDDAPNNGLHEVSGVSTATQVVSTSTLTVATGQSGFITRVGHRFATADMNVVITGDYAYYENQGGYDLTQLGILPGEWIWVGGDTASSDFVNAENNGFKRVKSVSATQIVVDKSGAAMSAETGPNRAYSWLRRGHSHH